MYLRPKLSMPVQLQRVSKRMVMPIVLLVVGIIAAAVVADKNAIVAVPNEASDEEVIVDDDIEHEEQNHETFKPTKEWQKIKPGQSIPAGLHVKMNLQTGEKEAKILESDKISGHHYELQGEEGSMAKEAKSRAYSPQELKEALKKFKAEEIQEKRDDVKGKFRSIEELRREFQQMKLNVKSESEMLTDLITRYKNVVESEKISILQDMEYIVHQYDAAQDFIKMDGLHVLVPDLNSTNNHLRGMVAFVIGSAMQGNPQVQIAVLEHNTLQKLLRLVSLDSSTQVRSRALYAISCLVRQFPFAQKRLVENGGFSAFADLFGDIRPEMQKLQLKVVTLLHDLVIEQELAMKYSKKVQKGTEEKFQQYTQINIASSVVDNNFCQLVPKLLPAPDYDTQEKVIKTMLTLADKCGNAFFHKLPMLRQLSETYRNALVEDDTDDYIAQLDQLVTGLIYRVERADKDEL